MEIPPRRWCGCTVYSRTSPVPRTGPSVSDNPVSTLNSGLTWEIGWFETPRKGWRGWIKEGDAGPRRVEPGRNQSKECVRGGRWRTVRVQDWKCGHGEIGHQERPGVRGKGKVKSDLTVKDSPGREPVRGRTKSRNQNTGTSAGTKASDRQRGRDPTFETVGPGPDRTSDATDTVGLGPDRVPPTYLL